MAKRERLSSSTTSTEVSLSPAPSSASLERRERWGWCSIDEPPAKAWTPDIKLPEKRQRRSPRKFPDIVPWCDETEEQARARACRIEAHGNRKQKRLVVAVNKRWIQVWQKSSADSKTTGSQIDTSTEKCFQKRPQDYQRINSIQYPDYILGNAKGTRITSCL